VLACLLYECDRYHRLSSRNNKVVLASPSSAPKGPMPQLTSPRQANTTTTPPCKPCDRSLSHLLFLRWLCQHHNHHHHQQQPTTPIPPTPSPTPPPPPPPCKPFSLSVDTLSLSRSHFLLPSQIVGNQRQVIALHVLNCIARNNQLLCHNS
jgi:hypothetical protein